MKFGEGPGNLGHPTRMSPRVKVLRLVALTAGFAACASTPPRVYQSGAGRADRFCVEFCAPAYVLVDSAVDCRCEAVVWRRPTL